VLQVRWLGQRLRLLSQEPEKRYDLLTRGANAPLVIFGVPLKFDSVVKIRRATACPTCQSFIYTLPVSIESDIEAAIHVFGNLTYPLNKFKIILLDSEALTISSMLGRTELRIKFKRNAEQLKIAVRAQLCTYLSEKMKTEVLA
jgi:hypothetical protein